jgi:hypothetical protein
MVLEREEKAEIRVKMAVREFVRHPPEGAPPDESLN